MQNSSRRQDTDDKDNLSSSFLDVSPETVQLKLYRSLEGSAPTRHNDFTTSKDMFIRSNFIQHSLLHKPMPVCSFVLSLLGFLSSYRSIVCTGDIGSKGWVSRPDRTRYRIRVKVHLQRPSTGLNTS